MENFIKRHTDKISAQEMIKANNAAEAAHREQIEKQNKQYEEEIDVLKKNADKLEARLDSIEGILKDIKEPKATNETSTGDLDRVIDSIKEDIEKRMDKTDEATHDIGVRIYRNVQASVIDEQKKQLDDIREDLHKQTDAIKGEFSVLLRRLDTTRNQLEEQYQNSNKSNGKGVVPLLVIVLLISLGDLVFNILRFLGLV
ncbi:hypothetical protein [Butyrivibrio sp. AE3006]|uniref:hypothetical protein n=1 Tax=Butyrivibrio sp. AE3006 TaxID=1280673 RepID=UPI00041A4540|nr:hypothetical protein [Butyrivibrio sp. AE3006]